MIRDKGFKTGTGRRPITEAEAGLAWPLSDTDADAMKIAQTIFPVLKLHRTPASSSETGFQASRYIKLTVPSCRASNAMSGLSSVR